MRQQLIEKPKNNTLDGDDVTSMMIPFDDWFGNQHWNKKIKTIILLMILFVFFNHNEICVDESSVRLNTQQLPRLVLLFCTVDCDIQRHVWQGNPLQLKTLKSIKKGVIANNMLVMNITSIPIMLNTWAQFFWHSNVVV